MFDGTDNFATRFLVSDACVLTRKTLVSAAVLRFEGQLSKIKPHAVPACPCYRCLYRKAQPKELVPTCSEAGLLGAVTGVTGTLQATGVAGFAESREAAAELGVRLIACEAGLRIAGIDPARLRADVEMAGVVTFLEATAGGQLISL